MKPTIDSSLTWYVVRATRPALCDKACANIRGAGFEVYLPRARLEYWSKRVGAYVMIERAAMPPYMFVGFQPRNKQFGMVRDLDGVGGFLGVNGEPTPIPAEVIDAILIAEMNMVFDNTPTSRRKKEGELDAAFPVGMAVKLIGDVNALLAAMQGEVIETNGRDRVRVAFGKWITWVGRDGLKAA